MLVQIPFFNTEQPPALLLLWRGPVLGGSKLVILRQIRPSVNSFFIEFYVGCSRNPTQQKKKHVCNFVSL